jgi:hypothetical protein
MPVIPFPKTVCPNRVKTAWGLQVQLAPEHRIVDVVCTATYQVGLLRPAITAVHTHDCRPPPGNLPALRDHFPIGYARPLTVAAKIARHVGKHAKPEQDPVKADDATRIDGDVRKRDSLQNPANPVVKREVDIEGPTLIGPARRVTIPSVSGSTRSDSVSPLQDYNTRITKRAKARSGPCLSG